MASPDDDPLAATAAASEAPSPGGRALVAGTHVGRYVIVEPLGSGGMGAVYAAKDPELGRRVAIKLLHPHLADMQRRLLREGQAIARLRHPNVVAIHDVGTHDGNVFLAMELVAGTTLRAWLDARHDWTEIIATFSAAGRGLAAAHAAGLVHRDFKPDNVLLGNDGSIVVTDFGLARTAGGSGEPVIAARESKPQLVEVTQTGAFVGTPAYMSPEQFRGEVADAKSDQFSFCVALYEALYGTRPFAGRTLAGLQDEVLHGTIAPRPADTHVPAVIHAAVERGLSREAAARFASMDALLAALAPPRAQRRWWPLALAGAAAVAGGFALLATRTASVDPCDSATAAIDRVWTPAARAKAASDDTRVFDRFAQRWRADRAAVCRVHTATGDRQAACLDRAAAVFASLVAKAGDARHEDPALPSLQRCARGDDHDAVVSSVQKPSPRDAALSPAGDRFVTLDHEQVSVHAMDTGLATDTREVPGAAVLAMWTASDTIALRDASGTKLFTLTTSAPGVDTTMLPAATSFVSPDLQLVVAVSDGDIQLRSLHEATLVRVLGRLEPGRDVLAGAWSPDASRFALLLGPKADERIQIFELPARTASELSFRGGPPIDSLLWHGNDRLLYSKRGVWSIDEIHEPPERRVAPGDGNERMRLLASNGTRVLVRRVIAATELVQMHADTKTVLPVNIDIVRVKGMTRDGRVAVECAGEVGAIEWQSKDYTAVGKAEDVIAADGTRILLVQGTRLLEVTHTGLRDITELPPSTARRTLACAAQGGTCALLSWGGTTPELRILHGDALGPPIRPAVSYPIRDVAVSPDGKHLVYAGGAPTALDIAEVATGAIRSLTLPGDPALCSATTVVAWRDDGTVLASEDCRGGLSRIVERSASGQTRTAFEGEGTVTGITPSKDDLYLNVRREDSELLVVDKI